MFLPSNVHFGSVTVSFLEFRVRLLFDVRFSILWFRFVLFYVGLSKFSCLILFGFIVSLKIPALSTPVKVQTSRPVRRNGGAIE